MKEEKIIEECEHKWIPNGITKRETWVGEGSNLSPRRKYGEVIMASCICEKCGKIKIKTEKD